jgi:uncharacterized protein YgiM (DUF1202 family)
MMTHKGLAAVVLVLAAAGTAPAADFLWPTSGTLTSTSVYANGAYHDGCADITAPYWRGIGAARAGTAYPWRDYYGANGVTIYHAAGYTTVYAHFVQWANVWSGQWVNANQHIAYVGSTGWSTGPHLHFGIYRYGTRVAIPSVWIGLWVNRGWGVPGWYSGLSVAPSATVLFRAKVTAAAGVNVRTGPGTGYARVGGLYYGNIVNVYGTSNGWYKVLLQGYYRWIAGWYTVRV